MEHRIIISTLALAISAAAQLAPVHAATPIDLHHQSIAVLQTLATANGLRADAGFKKTSMLVAFNHTIHTRAQQTYAGYPVWGGDFVIHTPQQNAMNQSSMNGTVYRDLQKDLADTPRYVFEQAQADKALREAIRLHQEQSGTKNTIAQSHSALMVYIDIHQKAHWAFLSRFRVQPAHALPEKPTYILDAVTLQVYKQWDDVKTLDAVTAGGFGGNEKEGKFVYDGSTNPLHFAKFDLLRDPDTKQCLMKTNDIVVKIAAVNHLDPLVQFPCNTIDPKYQTYWSDALEPANSAYSTANDALYSGELVNAMYRDWYNMPALRIPLIMRVHDPVGDNAYWENEETSFGDGSADKFYPFVSLGVVAHEISHGFTEEHSNLQYLEQSGGMNEAYSDMAAKAIEYYQTGSNKDWELGAEIVRGNHALRYMDNPRRDCVDRKDKTRCSIDNANDYKATMNVHNLSGVYNKAFYLLSTAPNWTTRKAFEVMMHANMMYWTTLSSYQSGACGVMEATKDYGYDTETVTAAFAKVGIDTKQC